jgi:hypothetical protein
MAATQNPPPGQPDKSKDTQGPAQTRPKPALTPASAGAQGSRAQAAGPQGFPVQPGARPQAPAAQPRTGTQLATAAIDGAKAVLRDAVFEKRPYLKFAFANPYNLSLFFGTLAASILTLNPLLGLLAIGSETLWLLHAPDSRRLRHLLWDPRFEKLRVAMETEEREARMQVLGEEERERVNTLVGRQQEIRRLAATNPSFSGELLRGELVKTDRLVDAFIDMAITCARYEAYLKSVDLDGLDSDRARWERAIKAGADNDPQMDIAKRNLAIILRRQDKMKEIKRYLSVAQGQLDLIENSFQLIADQIVTMQSPQQLSTQLDELLDGVESIRQATIDTEQMLNSMGIGSTT